VCVEGEGCVRGLLQRQRMECKHTAFAAVSGASSCWLGMRWAK
jgi:hypothetical protein